MSEADRHSYLKRRYGGSQSVLDRRERRRVDELLDTIGVQERILDLPCGHGRFTPQLRARAGKVLVCADHNQKNIDALVAAEVEAGAPIETRLVDLFDSLPFDDDSFDLVFNFRFFHHIFEKRLRTHVIGELVRVSRRYLLVSYYDDVWLHRTQKRLWRRRGHRRELPMVARSTIHLEFAQAGCRVLVDHAVLPMIHAHRIALFEKIRRAPAPSSPHVDPGNRIT